MPEDKKLIVIKEGLYFVKPRGQNKHTFIEIKKSEKRATYDTISHFKSGITFEEQLTTKEIRAMIEDGTINNVKEMRWD